MNIAVSFSIIILAALIHSSFQLSVSVLTLISGHAIGSKQSHAKLFRLTTSFVFGAGVMTLLLLSTISFILLHLLGSSPSQLVWAASCGACVIIAFLAWLIYFKREKGTSLWIPRSMAHYLTERTKSTKLSAETFGLGLSSVFGELLFIFIPLLISALVLIELDPIWQLTGLITYTIVSLLSLLVVLAIIHKRHNIGKIQKWRESNKRFIQFLSGAGLIVLSFYVYTYEILGTSIGGF